MEKIDETAMNTIEESIVETVSGLTARSIHLDRDGTAVSIEKLAGNKLSSFGIEIKGFVIREISDNQGYLDRMIGNQFDDIERKVRRDTAANGARDHEQ